MAERIDVMISSTARDLPHYREEARDACMRLGMFPIMMEHLPAMDADAIVASLAMVDEAEVYLGIIARRYGYVPHGHDISITEMEYNQAVTRDIPRLIFIMDEAHAATTDDDGDPAKTAQLARFKARLQQEQVVNFFTDPADLRAKIISSLARYHLRQTSTLYRPNIIPAPPQPYIAHPYTLLESERLLGRDAELAGLDDWLHTGAAPMLHIVAIGGMGKSSLAWKWFQEGAPAEAPLAGRLWWSFYENDAHYDNFITRALAYVSGEHEDAVRRLRAPEREERLLAILHQRPFLLVLDGLERLMIAYHRGESGDEQRANLPLSEDTLAADSTPDVLGILGAAVSQGIPYSQSRLRKTADPRAGAFLRKLSQLGAAHVLATTRLFPADLETGAGKPLPGNAVLELGGLADDDALKLWASFECNGEPEALRALFNSFDNYPLLVRSLAAEVARFRRAPGDFAAWQAAHPNFNPFQMPITQRQTHILHFALIGLEAADVEVLRTVAAFNAPAAYPTLADLLVHDARAPIPDENALDRALSELEDRGLLGWDRAANRYELHPVVRGVVWHHIDATHQQVIYEKLRAHFEAMPSLEDWRAVQHREELTASQELYGALVGLGRLDEAADVLANRLYRPLRYRFSDGQRLAALLEALFPAGANLPALADPPRQTWVLNALAQAYQMIGEPGRAVPLFEQSNALKEEIRYTVDLSTGLRDLAYAQRLVGGLHYAEAAARRALFIDRDDGNLLLEAISLQVLGLALAARGDWQGSARALDRSLDLAERTNANRAYNHQAMRALWMGDPRAARAWAAQAIEYSESRRLEAALILAMRLSGEAALGLDDLPAAEDWLTRALRQARAVNLMEEEIAALIALAGVHHRRGNPDHARACLAEIWEPVQYGPYRLFHADALNLLARIERDANQFDNAIQASSAAYALAWCDGEPYSYAVGLRAAEVHLLEMGMPPPRLKPFDPEATIPMVYVDIDPEAET
ncbi:MAG: DUF4062 domain-containing protein [Anaerolineales bacterium]